jgi:hypothetical protein
MFAGIVLPERFKFAVRVKTFFAVCFQVAESATWTLNVNIPVSVVVPENAPLECILIPVGASPQVMLQV